MRPIDSPEWANDLSNIVEPAQGKKDIGHVAGEKPAAGFENWLKNLLSTYAREGANASFAQLKSAFATLTPDTSYFPTDIANGIRYNAEPDFEENTVDVWIILNSQGTYEIVTDPYCKAGGTNYEHGDLPGSADGVRVNSVVFNSNFNRWIIVGDNSSQAPYSTEPKIAVSALTDKGFPLVVGDWTAVTVGAGGLNLKGVDYSTVTGTTIAVGENTVGSDSMLRSTDGGLNWTDVSPGGSAMVGGEAVYCVKAASGSARGEFVVIGQTAGSVVTGVHSSDDGLTWTDISISGVASQGSGLTTVTHNGRVWAAGRDTFSPLGAEVLTSADGLTWVPTTLPTTMGLTHQISADEIGGLIFLSAGGGVFYSETDGQTWKRATQLQNPDPLADGRIGLETAPLISVSSTGQIGVCGRMSDRIVAWFTPKQIMRNASYETPDL